MFLPALEWKKPTKIMCFAFSPFWPLLSKDHMCFCHHYELKKKNFSDTTCKIYIKQLIDLVTLTFDLENQ
jgi:hypothetical protein